MNTLFFKILREGDGHVWPLPSAKRPGRWTKVADPRVSNSNYHGITNPLRSWQPRAKLYPAELELKVSSCNRLARRLLGDRIRPASDDWSPTFHSVRCRLWPEVTRKWPYLPLRPDIQCFLAATARSLDPQCDISWVNLFRADLCWTDLYNADLHGADLSEAELIGTTLAGAKLDDANLAGAYLTWASLRGASLRRATLTGAHLDGSDLVGADLTCLVDADLTGAYRPDNPPQGWVPDRAGCLSRA